MEVYSITEGFSPILYCRPDVVTLGNPFDTMKRFCLFSQCSHLNLQTLFHTRWMLRRFGCVQIFLKQCSVFSGFSGWGSMAAHIFF